FLPVVLVQLRIAQGNQSIHAGFVGAAGNTIDDPRRPILAVEFRTAKQALRFAVPSLSPPVPEAETSRMIPVPAFESDTALLSDEMVVEHRRRGFEHQLEESIHLFEEPPYFADE
ncbi:MAG: hypothetical protein U5J83_00305, partial [Bryobacterales bacterium]|nr:hypothetical protein [Bryobacterales bacterium]